MVSMVYFGMLRGGGGGGRRIAAQLLSKWVLFHSVA